jgi:hypothetical protein
MRAMYYTILLLSKKQLFIDAWIYEVCAEDHKTESGDHSQISSIWLAKMATSQ